MRRLAAEAEPATEPDPRSLDLLPDFYNLHRYREALFAVADFIDSEQYQTSKDLSALELQILGWMQVQEQELGIERKKLEGKLRMAAEAARNPKSNRLIQEHGRHWVCFRLEGETEDEYYLTKLRTSIARGFPQP